MGAAQRRLYEEMGMTTYLRPDYTFKYRAELDNGLVEHEYDHVFTGTSDVHPNPDPAEVKDFAYRPVEKITRELHEHPEWFTPWFRLIMEMNGKKYSEE